MAEAFTILQGRTEMYTECIQSQNNSTLHAWIKWEAEKRWRNGITCMWFHMTHGERRWLWLAWKEHLFQAGEKDWTFRTWSESVNSWQTIWTEAFAGVYLLKFGKTLFPLMQKSNFCTLKTSLSLHHSPHFLFIFAILKKKEGWMSASKAWVCHHPWLLSLESYYHLCQDSNSVRVSQKKSRQI